MLPKGMSHLSCCTFPESLCFVNDMTSLEMSSEKQSVHNEHFRVSEAVHLRDRITILHKIQKIAETPLPSTVGHMSDSDRFQNAILYVDFSKSTPGPPPFPRSCTNTR